MGFIARRSRLGWKQERRTKNEERRTKNQEPRTKNRYSPPILPRRSSSFASIRRALRGATLISLVVTQWAMLECPRFPPLPPSIFILPGLMERIIAPSSVRWNEKSETEMRATGLYGLSSNAEMLKH